MKRTFAAILLTVALMLGLSVAPASAATSQSVTSCKKVVLERFFWTTNTVCVDIRYVDYGAKVDVTQMRFRVTDAGGTLKAKNMKIRQGLNVYRLGKMTEYKWKNVTAPRSRERSVRATGSVILPTWADIPVNNSAYLW